MHKIRLSPYHKIFYNEWQLDPLAGKYNVVFDQTLSERLDVVHLRAVLSRFIIDHLLFNSHVTETNDTLYWVANENIKQLDVFSLPYTKQQLFDYISHSFQLDKGPLYRFAIFTEVDGNFRFIAVIHNIILDTDSVAKFAASISAYYNDESTKINVPISRQRELLTTSIENAQRRIDSRLLQHQKFWRDALSDMEVADFKFLQPTLKTQIPTHRQIQQINIGFSKPLHSELKQLKKNFGMDPYIYGSVIMAILLYRYTSQTRFGISYLINVQDDDNGLLLGAQTNNNIYSCTFEKQYTVVDLINQYTDFIAQVRGHDYRYYPINDIVEHSGINIPNIFFAKVNLSGAEFNFNDVSVVKVNRDYHVGILADLVFYQDIGADQLCYTLLYNQAKVDQTILKQFIKHFKKLYLDILSDLNEDKLRPITDYEMLSSEEYEQIVYIWNDTSSAYQPDKTIHELFEQQAEKTPDNIAVVYEDKQLSYQELNTRANQLAHYLRNNHQVQGDALCALCLDRNEYTLIAIFGVLKAGGAYVPLDPSYPAERISYVLEDTQATVLITNDCYSERMQSFGNETRAILPIDNQDFKQTLIRQPLANPKVNITGNNLAYVIYTSGTTGKPKGVQLAHTGVVNLVDAESKEFALSDSTLIKNCLFYANYVFDAHVFELYAPLLNGHSIHIVNNEMRQDLELLSQYIIKNSIVLATIPPALLTTDTILKLDILVVAGEASDKSVLDAYIQNQVKVINAYGPTEATVCTNMQEYDGSRNVNNIGKPLPNVQCYVVDENLKPVPIGAAGELEIGGVGLARGYLNLPKLSSERFIENPFQIGNTPNSRLYKTGDLVRYLPDGTIEYIGRNDFQVKIRGYRIELGEIEAVLGRYPGVRHAVVVAREYVNSYDDNNIIKYLVGYYVAETRLDEDTIFKHIADLLPEYMRPSSLVYLEQLPLTINGKVDKKSLPEPEFIKTASYVAPKNDLEAAVCKVYAEVLGVDVSNIGMQDNFFKIGGNSILAIKLAMKLISLLNKEALAYKKISVNAIFEHKTIAELLDSILSNSGGQAAVIPGLSREYLGWAPLSFAQERLWFIEKYEGGSNAYNIPILYKLADTTQIDILNKAIIATIRRHEILHSLIRSNGEGNAYQQVGNLEHMPFVIAEIGVNSQSELWKIVNHEIEHIFRLDEEYPLRISLLRQGETTNCYILINVHHIAFDGWSADIFLRDITAYYRYYTDLGHGKNAVLNLPRLSIQYKDFAAWQKSYLTDETLHDQLVYWRNKLTGYENLNLLTDYMRPSLLSYTGDNVVFKFDREDSRELRLLARSLGVSLYSVMLAGFNLLLRVYTNQNDIIVGSPIANRHHHQILDLVGFFVNTLALRSTINPAQTIRDYISQTGYDIIEAQTHQDLPFEKLVKELNVAKDQSRYPIFQVMFGVQNFGRQSGKDRLFIDTDYIQLNHKIAKFDLTVMIDDSDDELFGIFNYATSLYKQETIQGFIETYTHILQQLTGKLHKTIKELDYLSEKSYNKIVYNWNATHQIYSSDKTIHELFEQQAAKSPDNIAVVYENKHLTYKELNSKANQLAHYLRETHQTKGDDLIALCLGRSEYMLIAALGVLKAGGAYVPLDPSYPEERIRYILEDIQAKVLISDANSLAVVTGYAVSVIDGPELQDRLSLQPIDNLPLNISSTNLAYVIYTSGTTGKPKGVLQLHCNVARLFNATDNWYKFNDKDVWSLFHSYVFDFSVWEMYGALLYGGKLVVIPGDTVKDSELFYELCNKQKITVLNQTPNAFYQFSDAALCKAGKLKSLRYVIFGGDKLNLQQLQPWFDQYGDNKPQLINMYGITETTVHVTYKKLSMADIGDKSHIGKFIPDMKAYILNTNLMPLPPGAIGELYVGGAGLARGYLNLAELSGERFIANPFQSAEEKSLNINTRLYKTGDLVRYLVDGNIEYIGRNDFQVKIRGFRIELGEIEKVLTGYQGIKHAVVLVKEYNSSNDAGGAGKYLIGYYVAEHKLDEDVLLKYLGHVLPEYMVPAFVVHLEQLPLTINGKLDQRILPDPQFKLRVSHVAPVSDLEIKMCRIYAEVLGIDIDYVGIRDDFFRLGGNSILAIKLVSKLNNQILNTNKISVADIFKYKTIANLLEGIFDKDKTQPVIIPQLKLIKNQQINLSFAQERLWFIENYEDGSNAYNIPMLYKLTQIINIDILIKAIKSTLARHEVLRTLIKIDSNGVGYQEISELETNSPVIKEVKLVNAQQYKDIIIHEVNYIFKLDSEFPVRVRLLYREDTSDYYLLAVIHHIACDGWSIDIFLRDIQGYYDYYTQLADNPAAILQLTDLGIQYKDFALWQREYLSGERLANQLAYWKSKLSGYENLNLPVDYRRPLQIDYSGDDIEFLIDKRLTAELRQLSKDLEVSLYSIMLSGFNLLLMTYANQNDIVIGTPIANRHHEQLSDLIGFFVNNLALRNIINEEQLIKDYIQKTGKEIIEAQLYQDLPFEKLVDELNIEKDTSRSPLFQVMFGVQSFGRQVGNNSIFIETEYKELEYKIAKFDLTLMIDDSSEELYGIFNYATSLYKKTTVQGFIDTYKQILTQLSDKRHKTIRELSCLSEANYKEIVYLWNETKQDYPADKTIHELFEQQVALTPHNIAVVYEDTQLTYQELNSKSNQLAHYLRNTYHIQGDDLIVICMERSQYILIAILGILKAGGAYVPLEPAYPQERINYVLEDTRAKVIITNNMYKQLEGMLDTLSTANLSINVTGSNLAYVIYTSGTTGRPKGVMIEHKSALNTICAVKELYTTKKLSKVSFFTSYVFDVSVTEIFATLVNGHELYILSEVTRKDTQAISDYLIKQKINVCYLPPVLLSLLRKEMYPDLVKVIYAGEPCDYETGKYWSEYKQLYNYYGPTEVSIYSSGKQVIDGDVNLIGKPLANTTCYILDSHLKPVPAMAIGELYVGGAGVARGYLNLPELTAERFIANPFQTDEEKQLNKNVRLYKTGDLVRYLPDGTIEYIGRNDSQVKVRGFRIELGEIEKALLDYPGIRQAVVLSGEYPSMDKTGSIIKRLVGYYVADKQLEDDVILAQLHESLPEYMIPDFLVYIDNLPLTVNGKLDKRALPSPEFKQAADYIAPANELEELVCIAYAEVLNIDHKMISVMDSFFKLGGNSILAISLVSKLQQHYNLDIKVNEIFSLKTPAQIAKTAKLDKYNLNQQFKLLKQVNYKLVNPKSYDLKRIQAQNKEYLKSLKKIDFDKTLKSVTNILLTGATGYFGCHVLYQLLTKTNYVVFLVVRADSLTIATQRIEQKFKFYFNETIERFKNRLHLLCGDLEQVNLGLDESSYRELASRIDSIIHAAALVKHFGDYEVFYKANVLATKNLLELSRQTSLKDFHYISTVSVLIEGYIPDTTYYEFYEDSDASTLNNRLSVYARSKYEGEKLLIEYRQFGITANIYRLGNMSMDSHTYINQENLADNAFYNVFKTMVVLGVVPDAYADIEISPVDCAAEAVVLIFDKIGLNNQSYHVFNPYTANILDLLSARSDMPISGLAFDEFIDMIKACLEADQYVELIQLFMLHQGWLQEYNLEQLTKINVLQDKTSYILAKLGFNWPVITVDMLSDLIAQALKK